ncbi:MAG: ferrous iron transport protein A [Firmicutes bacterium]|nr:ferrous iron transport protein A [Bacillota bacterium]
MIISLDQLPVGESGIVTVIDAHGLTRRRLLDLGLVPGTVVKTIRKSPAGDPIAYLIRGSIVALRVNDSKQISIKPFSEVAINE